VDYADLLKPSKSYSERRFELQDIYSGLRDLAVDLGVAIWTASQIRREAVEKDIVRTTDAAEDIQKNAICDVAIGLLRTEEHERRNEMEAYLLLNREGESVREPIVLRTDFDKMEIKEVSA